MNLAGWFLRVPHIVLGWWEQSGERLSLTHTHPPTCVHPHARTRTEVTRKRCEVHDWLFALLVTSVESADVIHGVVCLYSHCKHLWHRKHIQETLPNYTCPPAIKEIKWKFIYARDQHVSAFVVVILHSSVVKATQAATLGLIHINCQLSLSVNKCSLATFESILRLFE